MRHFQEEMLSSYTGLEQLNQKYGPPEDQKWEFSPHRELLWKTRCPLVNQKSLIAHQNELNSGLNQERTARS